MSQRWVPGVNVEGQLDKSAPAFKRTATPRTREIAPSEATSDKLIVDSRWSGMHGIGRYSDEVLPRLTVPWMPLSVKAPPSSLRDLVGVRRVSPRAVIYSPGYNAGFASARQVVTVHDLIHLQEGSPKYSLYYRLVLRPAIKRTGAVLTVSETSKAAIANWLGSDDVRIVNTGNGVSDVFTPGPPSAKWGEGYLLYVGNMKRHKNVAVLLRALQLIPDHRLVAVVPEPLSFAGEAGALGVSDRVHCVSRVSDTALRDLYRGALVTVVPSTLEGFGLPAAESLCCGRPVVYWDGCKSVSEIVGPHGVAVPSADDAAAWADAIDTAADMSGVDAAGTSSRYSWEAVGQRVSAALTDMIQSA